MKKHKAPHITKWLYRSQLDSNVPDTWKQQQLTESRQEEMEKGQGEGEEFFKSFI